MTEPRIAIIGAGIAGLSAADRLRGIAAVMVIEKGRGVGGRMATRRTDGAAIMAPSISPSATRVSMPPCIPCSMPGSSRRGTCRCRASTRRCFTLMIRLGTEAVPVPAASRVDHPVISWITANNTKPGRDPETCLVVHADNGWSEDHLQDPPEIVKHLIFSSFRQLFPQLNPDTAVSLELHRWRFANVAEPLGRPFLIDTDRRIAACGDWCIGNRVEAAFLSGLELGERLRTDISSERR